MRRVLTCRVMVLSGLLLTATATVLTGSAAAALPARPTVADLPATSVTGRNAATAAVRTQPGLHTSPALRTLPAPTSRPDLADVAPSSLHRLRPVPAHIAHPARPATARPQPHRAPQTARSAHRLTPLQRAVARIPGYDQHAPAVWVVSTRFGNYGVTDWFHNTVYISPRVPASRLDDVVRHEWGHVLSVRSYGGSVGATTRGLNGAFGGSGLTGAERAADCVATVLGARWRHYTSCSDPRWQRMATGLLHGRRP